MRKFFLFLPLLAALTLVADDLPRERFLSLYYNGNAADAHPLLQQAFSDEVQRRIWDERIHLQQEVPDCAIHGTASAAEHAIALLKTGDFAEARTGFGEDWLSQLGIATLATWESRMPDAGQAIQKALALSPDNPDIVFFAANIAPSKELTLKLFEQFLKMPQDDPYRKSVAEFSIQFLKKTWDMDLNVPVDIEGFERIKSDYKDGQLIIQGKINGAEKVSLLLDTGAGGITLKDHDWHPQLTSDVMALGIGKKQANRGTRLVLNLFEAGRYQLKNPVAGMSSTVAHGTDGIVGSNIFRNQYMLLPLKSGVDFQLFTCDDDPLTCLQAKGFQYKEKTTLPFYRINGLMIAKGRIRNSPDQMDIMVDTGAARSIIAAATAKKYTHVNYALSREVSQKSGLTGVGGRVDDLLIAENVEVDLGGIRKGFNQMMALNLGQTSEALELELDMILGRDFLQGYTLLIDYRKNEVTLLR